MILTELLHNYKHTYFSSGINSIIGIMIISHDMVSGGLLAATHVSHEGIMVLCTDLFSCLSGRKFQNVKSSATCTGLHSPPSEAYFILYSNCYMNIHLLI
jgi:hypothetical protein